MDVRGDKPGTIDERFEHAARRLFESVRSKWVAFEDPIRSELFAL